METPLFHLSFPRGQKKCLSASSGSTPVWIGVYLVSSAAVCSSSLLSLSQFVTAQEIQRNCCAFSNWHYYHTRIFEICQVIFPRICNCLAFQTKQSFFLWKKRKKRLFLKKTYSGFRPDASSVRRIPKGNKPGDGFHRKRDKGWPVKTTSCCFRRKNSRMPLTNRKNHGIVI